MSPLPTVSSLRPTSLQTLMGSPPHSTSGSSPWPAKPEARGHVSFRRPWRHDAPGGLDVTARGVATLVDNAIYGDITDYLAVPRASYILDVTDQYRCGHRGELHS